MIEPGRMVALQGLIRTIKEEQVYISYRTFTGAQTQFGCFDEDIFMTKCINSSFVYLTPVEYEIAWWQFNIQSIMASP